MTRYLMRQAMWSLVKLFVFVSIMFFFIQIMIPGDYVDQFALFMDASEREALRAQLGLDLPMGQRYLHWLAQVVRLDLGVSFSGTPMVDVFKTVIPATLWVFLTGTALAFLLGLWLGTRTGWRGSGLLSGLTTLGGVTLFTSFPPWLAFLLAYLLARRRGFVVMGEIGGLGDASYLGISYDVWRAAPLPPEAITLRMLLTVIGVALLLLLANAVLKRLIGWRLPGLLVLLLVVGGTVGAWYTAGIQLYAFDLLKISWLGILTYTLLSFGETMLIMQSSITDIKQEPYILTARAKGLPVGVIRERHAARTALLPVLSRLVISLPYLVTGVVIIESSVGWPGMGTSMWNALYWQNMPVVMNILLAVGALSLVARLVLDVLIAFLDPRIRFDHATPAMALGGEGGGR